MLLRSLQGTALHVRAAQLYMAGWTLRAIGESLSPTKQRSTVSGWISKLPEQPPEDPSIPSPSYKEYVPVRPVSPGISASEDAEIKRLAPHARRFRSGMTSKHPAAQANATLTALCLRLYEQNVTIAELAQAAGVSYRAMARRLGRA